MKDSVFYRKHTLNVAGNILDLSVPRIMGILNVTPDSFYDGGKHNQKEVLVGKAKYMIENGASILDVGGYSSRPGAKEISEAEELDRVLPAIESILEEIPDAIISVDTFRAKVAEEAILEGAKIVNDISGGEIDVNMHEIVAKYKVPYILMHMKGMPHNMQYNINYENLFFEMMDYFQKKLYKLHTIGVADIIVDLGFGFAKTREQNFSLLKNLNHFKSLECPILVGISRKSMIFRTLGNSPDESLNGTTALNMFAVQNGASILRVHDVNEASEVIKLSLELENAV